MTDSLTHLEALASIGVQSASLTWLHSNGTRRAHLPALPLARLRQSIDFWCEGSRERGTGSLVLRPLAPSALALIQLDDLPEAAWLAASPLALFTLETSPGNHQAWLAIPAAPPGLARALKAATGADPGASGACRAAGSLNCKEKYAPDFPIVRLLSAQPGRLVTLEELESAGLLPPGWRADRPAALAPPQSSRAIAAASPSPSAWPSYSRCLAGAPRAKGHDGPDRSTADFFWCLLCLRWGWSEAETAAELMLWSEKAAELGAGYAKAKAAEATKAARSRP